MVESSKRERFVPFRKTDVVAMCARDERLPSRDRESFRHFCQILQSVFHFEFHGRLERLKDCYAPFDPDADTRRIEEPSDAERKELADELVRELTALLDAANYERVTPADLEAALGEESLFQVRLAVDFDDFEQVLFFRRGESPRRETLRTLFGLRRREIEFVNYDRVAIFVKFRDATYFAGKKRGALPFEPGSTVIKLFQGVPKADLEMLFPNTEVRMRPIDKLLIGLPAAVGGVAMVATKLVGTIVLIASLVAFWLGLRREAVNIDQGALLALAAGLATLGAFIFKQVSNFKNRKIRFMKALADNLYFKNLDNNAGVFHHLLDAAEEEECKEAFLAYWSLLTSESPLTAAELDRQVEAWFAERWDCELDFDVGDAVAKLERLGLVRRDGERLSCLPLEDAKQRLDVLWDGYFDYRDAAGAAG